MTKPHIVVVDDQLTILKLIENVLNKLYTVKIFMSGQKAIDYLLDNPVDLVLLDYTMPGMSGSEILHIMQSNPSTSSIPVIFLTGFINEKIETEMLEGGAMDFITKPFSAPVLLARISNQLTISNYNKSLIQLVNEKTDSLRKAYERLKLRDDFTIDMLARVTDLRDHSTGDHIQRTTSLVRIIVQDLLENPYPGYEVTEEGAENIIRSSKLHDLGKIGVPDHILQKPGRLTSDEFDVIKTHTTHGALLLDEYIFNVGNDPFIRTAREITLYHHEKWNGAGYPTRMQGMDIPLSARIVALADAYDAITSSRAYKDAIPHEQALQIIQKDSGTHFDPYLAQVCLRHAQDFADAYN